MLVYALTIFAGAFLLFQVQPLIAKMLLPWFGGSAAVWTTCLLFFQSALLLGYLYAHGLIRWFPPKLQTRIHALLLAVSILALPIIPKDAWRPSGLEDPAFRVLGLLGLTLGLPYFLLSSTSPLLQAWYSESRKGALPYRFFALSNAASLLALVSYPILVEPVFSTRHQAIGWTLAYAGFALLCASVALRRPSGALAGEILTGGELKPPPSAPTWDVQLLWVALAACASTLLLAVTNHLSQNVAAVPFLWVLPLSLYLASFILCFSGSGLYRRDWFLRFLAVALGGMAYALAPESVNSSLMLLIPLYCTGLFLCCMVCHGELARLKPDPAHLSSFYLMIALGGALGGIFVGLIATHLFPGYFELPVGMGSFAVLLVAVLRHDPASVFYRGRGRAAGLLLMALTVALVAGLSVTIWRQTAESRVMVRNFYGALRVIDLTQLPRDAVAGMPVLEPARRKLLNGTIEHGLQFLSPDRRREPTTYYGPRSGVGLTLAEAGQRRGLRVGVVGLGTGTLATYGRTGDHYTFYEINPLVVSLAKTEFSFLADSQAKVDIVLGDARLSLEREPPQAFDVLALDAFSGDSIPVHLLTRQAFALYFRHLRDTGVLAVHITNRYLDLTPVVQTAAESLRKRVMVVDNEKDEEKGVYRATWVLVSGRLEFFDRTDVKRAGKLLGQATRRPVWTDDYSNLFSVLKKK
jgi:SAM-dependent methyltransferase